MSLKIPKIKLTNISKDIQKTLRKQAHEAEKTINFLLDENADSNKCKYYTPVILNTICFVIHCNQLLSVQSEINRLEILFQEVLDDYITESLIVQPNLSKVSFLISLVIEYRQNNLCLVASRIQDIYTLYNPSVISGGTNDWYSSFIYWKKYRSK